jgi:threonine dehydratase
VVGVQVPRHERQEWERFVAALPYPHWDESANPAYRLFLGQQAGTLPHPPPLVAT